MRERGPFTFLAILLVASALYYTVTPDQEVGSSAASETATKKASETLVIINGRAVEPSYVDTGNDGWRLSAFFAAMRHEMHNADTGKRIRRTQRNRFTQGTLAIIGHHVSSAVDGNGSEQRFLRWRGLDGPRSAQRQKARGHEQTQGDTDEPFSVRWMSDHQLIPGVKVMALNWIK